MRIESAARRAPLTESISATRRPYAPATVRTGTIALTMSREDSLGRSVSAAPPVTRRQSAGSSTRGVTSVGCDCALSITNVAVTVVPLTLQFGRPDTMRTSCAPAMTGAQAIIAARIDARRMLEPERVLRGEDGVVAGVGEDDRAIAATGELAELERLLEGGARVQQSALLADIRDERARRIIDLDPERRLVRALADVLHVHVEGARAVGLRHELRARETNRARARCADVRRDLDGVAKDRPKPDLRLALRGRWRRLFAFDHD